MIERTEIHGTVIQYLFNNYFRKRYFSKAEGGRPKADRTKHVSGLQRDSFFAPLYYPDTLVNPDTCLSIELLFALHIGYLTQKIMA